MAGRLLLLALCASLAAGCKRKGGPDSVKLTDVELPGLTVALPEGQLKDDEARVLGAGGVEVKRATQPRMTELRWSTMAAPLPRDELLALLRASTSAQMGQPTSVDFGPPVATQVCGEPVETTPGQVDGKRLHLTSWFRAAEQRFFYLTTLADDDAGVVHQRVLASIRCLPVPQRALRSEIYPNFSPPAGMQPTGIKDGAQAFGGPDESFVFMGAEGKVVDDALLAPGSQPALGRFTAHQLARALDFTLDPDSARVLVDATGGRRVVMTGQPIIDGNPMQLVFMYWYCDKIGRSFIGIYMKRPGGDGGTLAGGEQALLGASCPP